MTMIEKMAQAAYEKFNENQIGCCEPPWDELPPGFKERMVDAQRAAIEAMREPSLTMIEAAWVAGVDDENVSGVWEGMVDAALGEFFSKQEKVSDEK